MPLKTLPSAPFAATVRGDSRGSGTPAAGAFVMLVYCDSMILMYFFDNDTRLSAFTGITVEVLP